MVVISISAHKGVSTEISHIINLTSTKRSHHVEHTDLDIYTIVPKLPVSITAVMIFFIQYDFTHIKSVDGNVVNVNNVRGDNL